MILLDIYFLKFSYFFRTDDAICASIIIIANIFHFRQILITVICSNMAILSQCVLPFNDINPPFLLVKDLLLIFLLLVSERISIYIHHQIIDNARKKKHCGRRGERLQKDTFPFFFGPSECVTQARPCTTSGVINIYLIICCLLLFLFSLTVLSLFSLPST